MIDSDMKLNKGMEDSKAKYNGICKYYMYKLGGNNLNVSNKEYSFNLEGNWYKIKLAELKVRRQNDTKNKHNSSRLNYGKR